MASRQTENSFFTELTEEQQKNLNLSDIQRLEKAQAIINSVSKDVKLILDGRPTPKGLIFLEAHNIGEIDKKNPNYIFPPQINVRKFKKVLKEILEASSDDPELKSKIAVTRQLAQECLLGRNNLKDINFNTKSNTDIPYWNHALSRNQIDKIRKTIEKYKLHKPINNEQELRQRVLDAQCGDQSAIEDVLMYNAPVVFLISHFYYGLDFTDIFNIGMTGLLKAIEKFDSKKENTFLTYAKNWIQGAILSELKEKGKLIKIPQNQQTYVNKVKKIISQLEQQNAYISPETVSIIYAKSLLTKEKETEAITEDDTHWYLFKNRDKWINTANINYKQIEFIMNNNLVPEKIPLDTEDVEGKSFLHNLVSTANDENDQIENLLEELQECLKPKELNFLLEFFGVIGDKTKQSIAEEQGLTVERIKQKIEKILTKVKTHFKKKKIKTADDYQSEPETIELEEIITYQDLPSFFDNEKIGNFLTSINTKLGKPYPVNLEHELIPKIIAHLPAPSEKCFFFICSNKPIPKNLKKWANGQRQRVRIQITDFFEYFQIKNWKDISKLNIDDVYKYTAKKSPTALTGKSKSLHYYKQ